VVLSAIQPETVAQRFMSVENIVKGVWWCIRDF
jgi:regulator of extracellular matrix RemA (YlzA/DUF370 family)